jgi:hypothetical protein
MAKGKRDEKAADDQDRSAPGWLHTLLVLVTLAGTLHAQQNPCLNRTIAVNVLNEEGHFVEGLSAQNFRGKVHGQRVEIVSAAHDSGPRRIVIVLDASGSMGNKWGLEIYEAEGLLSTDPDSSFALITFATHIRDRIDFTQGRKKISDELAGLQSPAKAGPEGRTALRDALTAAVDLLRPAQLGDAIYLISDGGENASKVKDTQFRDVLVSAGVRLFALITVEQLPSRSRTPEEAGGPDWLSGLVTATGGDFTILKGDPDFHWNSLPRPQTAVKMPSLGRRVLTFATAGFDEEMTEYYRVAIKLPEPLDKPRDLDLDALDAKGKRNSHWLIVYPHRLAACP